MISILLQNRYTHTPALSFTSQPICVFFEDFFSVKKFKLILYYILNNNNIT